MLYLNSLENRQASRGLKVLVARERHPEMQSVPELAPSPDLQRAYEAGQIGWETYRERYLQEMRREYTRPQSRLKRLALYSLKNDVTLHTAHPYTEGTYRAILKEIIDSIWKRLGSDLRVEDLAPPPSAEIAPPVEEGEAPTADTEPIDPFQQRLREIAAACDLFTPRDPTSQAISCAVCKHYDAHIYACLPTARLFIEYEWVHD